mgnify:CR=1 FL=1
MHKKTSIGLRPAPASGIQVFLEIALLFLRVLSEIANVFGINFGGQD